VRASTNRSSILAGRLLLVALLVSSRWVMGLADVRYNWRERVDNPARWKRCLADWSVIVWIGSSLLNIEFCMRRAHDTCPWNRDATSAHDGKVWPQAGEGKLYSASFGHTFIVFTPLTV
jgi:hypothetical protein